MSISFKSFFLVLSLFMALTADVSAQLARQWVARFNAGVKNSSNGATAMAIDDRGNVLVTGWVTRKGTGIDYATVKYSPDGKFLGVAYYNGGSNNEDKAVGVVVDTTNIYVTGYSLGSNGYDIVTVMYDSNLAVIGGPKTYNGPGNGEDKPVAIAINDSFNVYVSGFSYGGSGTGIDYVTLKYDAALNDVWAQRYNGSANLTDSALAMVLQGTTALYVTGTTRDSLNSTVTYDYKTIKYDAVTGDTLWTARYQGDGTDIARSIALRTSTDVYVTGSSSTDTTGYDYLTVRYAQLDGSEAWASRYNDPANGNDNAYAVSTSSSGGGRVYVTGRSLTTGSFNDIVTMRLNLGDGSANWTEHYNGTANDDDGGIAILGGNNPYLIGSSMGAGVGNDYGLLQYNGGNGNLNVNVRYNGSGNSEDIPAAVLTASGGVVYVTGSSKPGLKGSDFLTIKYVDQDDIKYRTFVQNDLIQAAVSVKVGDPTTGNVRDEAMLKAYPKIKKGFAGYPGGLVAGQPRPDSAGSYAWIRFDKGKPLVKFLPQAGAAGGFDTYDGKPHLGEKKNPKYPKMDNHLVGELVTLRVNIGASDAEITPPTLGDLGYDDGDTSNHYNGMTIRQVASLVDNYLTYWKQYPTANWALFDTILSRCNRAFLGPAGPLPWVSKSPLVVTGVNPVDSVVYLQTAIAPLIDPLAFPPGSMDNETPKVFSLSQNYPNPFNPSTTIEFDLPEQSLVTLKVYDMIGREVATLLDQEEVSEGKHDIEFAAATLASGVYFYRIVANEGQFRQVRKMLMMK